MDKGARQKRRRRRRRKKRATEKGGIDSSGGEVEWNPFDAMNSLVYVM